MLSKTQSASINPYRLDKSKGKYLPPTEVPLRQCGKLIYTKIT